MGLKEVVGAVVDDFRFKVDRDFRQSVVEELDFRLKYGRSTDDVVNRFLVRTRLRLEGARLARNVDILEGKQPKKLADYL